MYREPQEEHETRRIILLRGKNPEVLVGFDGVHRILPEVEIPRWQRVAERLTAALRESCGIDAVSISRLEASPEDSGSKEIVYEIMEPIAADTEAPREKEWVSVDGLVESGFRDQDDVPAVRRAVAQSATRAEDTTREPFGKLGWFPELRHWVEEQIGRHGIHLNGRFRQLNASPAFSLIRFETDGPAVWFKAVGTPNQREFPITMALADRFPRFVPEMIAPRPEWNGWLSREADGPLLEECPGPASWEGAARDLAQLQVSSLGRSLHLLNPGARDLRAWALADFVEPFFRTMGQLMERQTKMPPPALSREELRCLSGRVWDALTALEETGIPSTLGHLDVNPGNIVCSLTGCVFLDWAEAFVGHPFLTFQYLLEHFRRTYGRDHAHETQLVARYASPWRAFFSDSDIHRALEVAPLAAVFTYAAGNDSWTDPLKVVEPRTAGYLRGLTRRMDREARALVERSLPCPS